MACKIIVHTNCIPKLESVLCIRTYYEYVLVFVHVHTILVRVLEYWKNDYKPSIVCTSMYCIVSLYSDLNLFYTSTNIFQYLEIQMNFHCKITFREGGLRNLNRSEVCLFLKDLKTEKNLRRF